MRSSLSIFAVILLALLAQTASADPFMPSSIPPDPQPVPVIIIPNAWSGGCPCEFLGGAPIGYCGGDPVNRTDPMGTTIKFINGDEYSDVLPLFWSGTRKGEVLGAMMASKDVFYFKDVHQMTSSVEARPDYYAARVGFGTPMPIVNPPSELTQFIQGDFNKKGSTTGGTIANSLTPFVPIAGQVAGARDTVSAVKDFYQEPTWSGIGKIGVNALTILPAVGYFAKGEKTLVGAEKTFAKGSMLFQQGNSLRGEEKATEALIRGVESNGRAINYARAAGTEAERENLRFLDYFKANANAGGEGNLHLILREDPRKIEVLEEFLHGTQHRLGLIDRLGMEGAEIHVKDFMIRHQKSLGLSDADVEVLRQMMGGAK